MREIKFRVPMKCQNGHFNFYYYSIRFGNMLSRFGEPSCKCPKSEFNEGYSPCGDDEQFTGLLDRNLNEIYEGDVIESSYESISGKIIVSLNPVEWNAPEFSLGGKQMGYNPHGVIAKAWRNDQIVIGNIYANPSLLNEEERP
jgi:hypothetical protein